MKPLKVALLGNPNTGKTSIFNRLTGLNQHVGNFPGVTVDVKVGRLKKANEAIDIIDFPGTYSIYPHSADEKLVYEVLSDVSHAQYPDLAVVVVDASNLERNLLLFSQLYDLKVPLIMAINMSDLAQRKGIIINLEKLQERFPNCRFCTCNARVGLGIPNLIDLISSDVPKEDIVPVIPDFKLHQVQDEEEQKIEIKKRYSNIKLILKLILENDVKEHTPPSFLDRITIHRVWGYVIFTFMMLLIFQLIFTIGQFPMDWMDTGFNSLAGWVSLQLPSGVLNDLICSGIIPGLGGVLVFLPQIIILFFLLGILEETGYLTRAVFIMDKLMRPFGLNGKSVVPLISSVGCAIPGIMSTRSIPNWKERLTTILVAPLMSCSARVPVYTLLIALVIPRHYVFGFINVQGLLLFGLYSLGIISALIVSSLISRVLKTQEKSFFLLEMPTFKAPRWKNILLNLMEKSKLFVLEAGKVIIIISILLWALATYGPTGAMEKATVEMEKSRTSYSPDEFERKLASAKLEQSYMGILGKSIEPVIKPLGFDWKIGISLITSFAAREVFVGSMATIYSVHQEDQNGLLSTMRSEKHADNTPVYSVASGVSLMVFYVFAMQCMATLAIVKRETKSWKWPIVQLVYMGILAYLSSFIVYQILS